MSPKTGTAFLMSQTINVYCDESCHLEHDGKRAMVFGAVWCPSAKKREITARVRDIRQRHHMTDDFEFKWTKVGPSKLRMYLDLVDYFFDDSDLRFRCLVIPDKAKIDHDKFNQSHDDWYYKMYFNMLKVILRPSDQYSIYVDIKDTRSKAKSDKLHDVLCNNAYDFSRNVILKVQQIRSHEVVHTQIADILIGAMSYRHRGEKGSTAKLALVDRIAGRSGYSLTRNTLVREEKFNIFVWRGSVEDDAS